jgi:hypothetical protein
MTFVRASKDSHSVGWKSTDLELRKYWPPMVWTRVLGISCMISLAGQLSGFTSGCPFSCENKMCVKKIHFLVLRKKLAEEGLVSTSVLQKIYFSPIQGSVFYPDSLKEIDI